MRFIAGLLATIICASVFAANGDKDEANEAFRKMFNEGIELFNQGDYVGSCERFRKVYEDRPVPLYMFNIGRCEKEKGRYDLSYEAFLFFMNNAKDKKKDEFMSDASSILEELKLMTSFIDVDTSDVYDVWVDDEKRASTPLNMPIPVLVGPRHILIKQNNEVVLEKNIVAIKGDTQTLKIIPVNPKNEIIPKTPPSSEPVPPTSMTPLMGAGVGILGLGGAMLISGLATGLVTMSKEDQLEKSCPDKKLCDSKYLHDSGRNLSVVTNVFLSVGAVALVSGTIMTILGTKNRFTESVRILPSTWGEYGHGLVVEGQF